VGLDDASQASRVNEASRMLDKAEKTRGAEWKDIGVAKSQPDPLEPRYALEIRQACETGGIDRADPSADHKIRTDAGGQQRAHHADLDGAEAASAAEDECGFCFGRRHRESLQKHWMQLKGTGSANDDGLRSPFGPCGRWKRQPWSSRGRIRGIPRHRGEQVRGPRRAPVNIGGREKRAAWRSPGDPRQTNPVKGLAASLGNSSDIEFQGVSAARPKQKF